MEKGKIKLYLDIDGVLLGKKQEIPENVEYFINFILQYFDCYWLTTHCRQGSNKAINYLKQFYSQQIIKKLEVVKANDWVTLKTEGIDFETKFIWLEDYPLEAEKKVLKENQKEKN